TAPAAASPTTAAAPTTAAGSAPAGTTAAPTTAAPTTAPSAAATTAPTAAAATGPESKKQLIAWATEDTADHDTNRDAYNSGQTEHLGTLLKYDQDFNITPDLAESYTNNGPVFTFKIRKGTAWSDGVPLKAQDFAYSLRRQI